MDLEKIKELVPAEDIKLDLAVNKAIDLIKSSAEISESAPGKEESSCEKEGGCQRGKDRRGRRKENAGEEENNKEKSGRDQRR